MTERKLTLIIVPHSDLETRTFEIPYRRLKLLTAAAAGLVVLFTVMVSSWWYVAAQAARVPGLERYVERLEDERDQVFELARTLEEVEARFETVRQLLGADAIPEGRDTWLGPLRSAPLQQAPPPVTGRPDAWPVVPTGYVTRQLSTTADGSHPGIDIAVPQDSYIRSAGPGFVTEVGEDPILGNYVVIDHGEGFESLYGHASHVFVEIGDQVERTEVVALSGSTGRSTAPHLHFEIRKDGEPLDPLTFIGGA